MSDSPAVILFDINGNPVGTVIDGVYYRLQVEAKLAAGEEIIGKVGIDGSETGGLATEATLALIKAKTDNLDVALSTRAVTGLTDTQLRNSPVPISGTVTSNIGTTNGLALDATLTSGTQKAIARGGAKGSTVAADITSTAVDADTQALHIAVTGTPAVSISGTPAVTVSSGTVTANAGTGTFSVSAAALPLPSGAATEATLTTRLAESTFTTRINTLGQKNMANSTPVVLASNQGPIDVVVVSGEAGGSSNLKMAYDIGESVIYIGEAELGSATSASVWTIKRVTLIDGSPTFTEWSDGSAVWDDRLIEVYT